MRTLRFALAAALCLAAAPAIAQIKQTSVRLNEPTLASQYLSVTDKTGLQGNPAYTIEAWVYPTAYTNFPTIVGNNFATSFWLGLNATGHVRFYPRGGSFIESAAIVPLNQWTHVAATYSNVNGYKILLNGLAVTSGTSILGVPGTDPGDLRIGADRSGAVATFFWRGRLDEVRIWNYERTAVQTQLMMYDHAGTPRVAGLAYSGLVAYWDMEDPTADRFFDRYAGLGAASNDAFLVNAPTADPQAPPITYNTAILLNGVDDYLVMPVSDGFDGGLTIEAWIAPSRLTGYPTIVGRDYLTSFWLGIGELGKLRFYPTGGGGNFVESSSAIRAGIWTHVAVTYKDGETRMYIDGYLNAVHHAITGPVGENGLDVYVGADHEPTAIGGFDYPFEGMIDEVRITRGRLSRVAIQDGMFRLTPSALNFIADEDGVARERLYTQIEHRSANRVFGSSARFVRSGAPLFAAQSTLYGGQIGGYHTAISPTGHLPGGIDATFIGTDIYVPEVTTVSSVEVFVDAPTLDLTRARIRVRSPSGTSVTLLDQEGVGRDVCTVFRDGAAATLANGFAPYTDGVQPNSPLSTFNGEPAAGLWRISVDAPGAVDLTVGLWAWGIAINGNHAAAVNPPTVRGALTLRMAGTHPVRGDGALVFELPEADDIELSLYDLGGRCVQRLASGRYEAGAHRVAWSTGTLEPGMYFARLRALGEERNLKVGVMR